MRVALLVLALLASVAHAAPTTEHPLDDAAKVVPDADEPALEAELVQLREQGVWVAVVVVDSTRRESIESYARQRALAWSSRRGGDAAVLVLAVKDRKSRLEVSDSLREKFPDARAQSILDNIKGYLRTADYTGAIRAVITEVRNGASGVAPDTESPHPQVPDPVADQPAVAAPVVEQPREYEPPPRNRKPLIYSLLGGAALLLIAFLWARSRISSRATLTANHVITSDRGIVLETLWCVLLIFGGILYVIGIIMATSRNASSSSNSWGRTFSSGSGSSSSGSSSGGGSGWSGGGASSGW